jgi:filamentous hemagglutinin family protein
MDVFVCFCRWSLIVLPVAGIFTASSVLAQSILPANDGTETIVTPAENQFDISGGQLSSDGTNLFHSFQEFGLQDGQVANFLSNPNIDNIFGRVTGGNASEINGLIQVTGGNSNLFLMNPAGIVFGANASLNIPADFTVTTATGIGFDSGSWFNAFGDNSWASLLGTPNAFDFSGVETGTAIVNNGNLAVASGQNIGFFGSSVTNSGTLSVPDGGLIVTAIPESRLIRISQPGNVLSLEIEPPRDADGNLLPFEGLDLPGMLTGTPGSALNQGEITAEKISIYAGTVENSGSIDASNPTGNAGTLQLNTTPSINPRGQHNYSAISLNGTILAGSLDVTSTGGILGGGNITTNGDISLTAQTQGIHFTNATLNAGGNIALTGINTATTGSHHQGIWLTRSTLSTSGTGNISLEGQGGNGASFNRGIQLDESRLSVVDGNLNLFGMAGNGNGSSQQGIWLSQGNLLEATGNGNLELRGIGGRGSIINQGVTIQDSSRVRSNYGDITVTGTGGMGRGVEQQGILLIDGATIQSTGTGNITLSGTAGSGTGQLYGVEVRNPGMAGIATNTGNVLVEGTGTGSSEGVRINNGTIGDPSMTGNITFRSDTVGIFQVSALQSQGQLVFQPPDAASDLTLNPQTLRFAQDGFSQITIGHPQGSGMVTLTGNVTEITDPLTIQSPDGILNLGENLTTTHQDLTLNGAISLTGDLELSTGTGNLTLLGTVDGGHNLTLTTEMGNITLNGDVGNTTPLNNFNVNTTGTVELDGNITVAGTVTAIAEGNIMTGDMDANEIALTSREGEVITGNLKTSGDTDGGNLVVDAELGITTGAIDVSGNAGTGGDVTLNSGGDIGVMSIDAEGGNTGGNITIVGEQNVRITGTLIAANGQPASLSAIGTQQSGTIYIEHGGGGTIPFVVGNALTNGTAGTVTTGTEEIEQGSFPDHEIRGDISIISGVEAPPIVNPEPNPETSTPDPDISLPQVPTPEIPTPETQIPEIPTPETQIPEIPAPETQIPEIPAPEIDLESNPIEFPAENSGSLQPTPKSPETAVPETGSETIVNAQNTGSDRPNPNHELPATLSVDNETIEKDRLLRPDLTQISHDVALLNGTSTTANSWADSVQAVHAGEGNVISSGSSNNDSSGDDSAAVDAIFDSNNDMVATVWQTEQYRNQEFEGYLGVIADLPNQNVAITATQEHLRNIETQTGKRSALVYIFSRASQLELVVVSPEGSPIRRSVPEANQKALIPIISEFRRQLTSPRMRDRDTYLTSAQQLYQWLIAPIEPDLQAAKIDTLLLSLDSGLRSLPLAALHDGSQFLIEKYGFSLIPSFSLLDSDYRPIETVEVLAMGASEFNNQNPLPSVPIELTTISQILGHGTAFLNENFTRENLISQHKNLAYPILHLATHADFQGGIPRNSYIQLWNEKLTLDELPSLNLGDPQVELVVLSACRTAVGDREAELGFGGLAIMSGAKSALASLWYVSDEGTFSLMSGFYGHLGTGEIKAEALRQAQMGLLSGQIRIEGGQLYLEDGTVLPLPPELENLGDRNLSHPYYWSSFTLIGSPW